MGFAQVLVQARGEGAAHNGVQHLEREPVGGRARRAHVADPDHGLRRAWVVDQIQRARGRRRGGRARERRHLAPLPAAEPRGREPAYFGERDVAHDQQARAIGPVVRPIELSDGLAREPGGGAVRAVQRVPVRLRAPAPCCNMVAVKVASPGTPDGSRAAPASSSSCTSTTGTLCISTTAIMRPFGSIVVCTGGSLSAGGGGNAGGLVRSTWADRRSEGPAVRNTATTASTRLARPTPTARPPVRRSALIASPRARAFPGAPH